ncbi:MAG: ATP-dependent DNA helicase RecQ [Bdellovibrio sp.]|nr:ATP-dependent DNA helicase RecQ [Bdellovibrio sp.]
MQILRDFQIQALRALDKKSAHVICVAPTGSGKSLIYELYATKTNVRTILVTPLLALARQQKKTLSFKNTPVFTKEDLIYLLHTSPKNGVLILNPESFLYAHRLRLITHWKPNFFVVDECHCFWDWGEDFRVAFTLLPKILKNLHISKSLWLTATLPYQARAILNAELPSPVVEIGKFEFTKKVFLSSMQIPWQYRVSFLIDLVRNKTDPGLIFVQTRNEAEKLALLLSKHVNAIAFYHAGLSHEERIHLENQYKLKTIKILVSTSAFGMGMNLSHLRWVILYQLPPSVLFLTQAIGRVGRDSNYLDHAYLLWEKTDFQLLEGIAFNSVRKRNELYALFDFLKNSKCLIQGLTKYFENEEAPICKDKCNYCTQHNA